MPADSPPSLIVAPDLRRRLQQRYEDAMRLAGQPRPERFRIHSLLAECLRADPGNILYIDAVLANLRQRDQQGGAGGWWRKWFARLRRSRDWTTVCSNETEAYSVLRAAPDSLWREVRSSSCLQRLAQAAAALDLEEAELRYHYAARDAAPDDPVTLQALARALTRQGRFDDAVGPWFAVLALKGNSEAAQAVDDLRDSQATVEAENTLAEAQIAAGGDLTLLRQREEARLARSSFRIELARRRASHDVHPRAQALVAQLEREHRHQEIEILNARAERSPLDIQVRLELSRRLKRLGNYSGAIERLDEAQRLMPQEAGVLIELGENWQFLRQFAKAMGYYRQALAASVGDQNVLNLARYRAAILAAALGQTTIARAWLTEIVAADPHFLDARERLDKLPAT